MENTNESNTTNSDDEHRRFPNRPSVLAPGHSVMPIKILKKKLQSLPESPSVPCDNLISQLAAGTPVKKKDNAPKEKKTKDLQLGWNDSPEGNAEEKNNEQLDEKDPTARENDDLTLELLKLVDENSGKYDGAKPSRASLSQGVPDRHASVLRKETLKNSYGPNGTDTNIFSKKLSPFDPVTFTKEDQDWIDSLARKILTEEEKGNNRIRQETMERLFTMRHLIFDKTVKYSHGPNDTDSNIVIEVPSLSDPIIITKEDQDWINSIKSTIFVEEKKGNNSIREESLDRLLDIYHFLYKKFATQNSHGPNGTDSNIVSKRSPLFDPLTFDPLTPSKEDNDWINSLVETVRAEEKKGNNRIYQEIMKRGLIIGLIRRGKTVKNTHGPDGTDDTNTVSKISPLTNLATLSQEEYIAAIRSLNLTQEDFATKEDYDIYIDEINGVRREHCHTNNAAEDLNFNKGFSIRGRPTTKVPNYPFFNNAAQGFYTGFVTQGGPTTMVPNYPFNSNANQGPYTGYAGQGGHSTMVPNCPHNNNTNPCFYTGFAPLDAHFTPYLGYSTMIPFNTYNNRYAPQQVGNGGSIVNLDYHSPLHRTVSTRPESAAPHQYIERPCIKNTLAMQLTGADPKMSKHRRM